jgi:hypothetical protein
MTVKASAADLELVEAARSIIAQSISPVGMVSARHCAREPAEFSQECI